MTQIYTELDAVNALLVASGQSPVSSLSLSEGSDIQLAKFYIDRALKDAQLEGFAINHVEKTFTADAEGRIAVPTNVFEVELLDAVYSKDTKHPTLIMPTISGQRIMDANTREPAPFEPGQKYSMRLTYVLEFDELTAQQQRQIISTAAARFQVEQGSNPDTQNRMAQEELYYRGLGKQADLRQRKSTIFDSGGPAWRASKGRNANGGFNNRYPHM